AGAGVELGLGVEERLPATDALIDAVALVIPVSAGEGAFGALFAGDVELLLAQLPAPLVVGFHDLVGHGQTSSRGSFRGRCLSVFYRCLEEWTLVGGVVTSLP